MILSKDNLSQSDPLCFLYLKDKDVYNFLYAQVMWKALTNVLKAKFPEFRTVRNSVTVEHSPCVIGQESK